MNYAEQGIYLNLLLLQFERGDLSMDVIDRYLPKAGDWEIYIQEILKDKFTKLPNGTFRNERMATVIQEQQSKSEKRSRQTAAARASKQNKTNSVTNSVTEPVTKRELELEKELELELEPKKELDHLPRVSAKRSEPARPTIELAVQLWNDKAIETGALAQVKRITEARRTKWNRLCEKAGYYNSWCESLHRLPVVNTATFRWQPTFDWTLNETNITKLSEGNYEQSKNYSRKTRVAKFVEGS